MKRLNPAIALPAVVVIALVGLFVQIARRSGTGSSNLPERSSEPARFERVSMPDAPVPPSTSTTAPVEPPTAPPAVPSADGEELQLRVTGLKKTASELRIAVFESADGFPQPSSSSSTLVVSVGADQSEATVDLVVPMNVPVAVAVFQDLDGNGLLSKNAVGIPSEPYGFSNGARGLFGPPTFEAATLRGDALKKPQPIHLK